MKPKVALVYDRVNTPHGGAEQVLSALHQAFPDAPLYTSLYHPQAKWADDFQIQTSFLQKIPFFKRHHRYLALLMPLAFESFDLSEYDIVISVTSAEAKGVLTQPHQLHVCYLLTPTRYLYSHRAHYQQTHWPFKLPLIGWLARRGFDYLTWWDQAAAYRPDVVIPISQLVANRLEEFYQRKADAIIYPPLKLEKTDTSAPRPYYLPQKYLLAISRLVSYKRLDLAIQACQQLKTPLVIIGSGPAEVELKKLAGDDIYFLGNVNLEQKKAILAGAHGVLMPGVEDFGITALETVINGKPIILHRHSGASELLTDKEAIFIDFLSVKSLTAAIGKIDRLKLNPADTAKKLDKYAINGFIKRFNETVLDFWQQKKGNYERT